MEIFVANEQDLPADEARLAALARYTLTSEEVDESAELSVLLVTSDHIKQLNGRYGGEERATDVLAFPMMEDEEEVLLLGDVVICPEVAMRNAQGLQQSLSKELDVLVVRGTLHLLSYHHQGEDDAAKMDERQREVLDSFSRTFV